MFSVYRFQGPIMLANKVFEYDDRLMVQEDNSLLLSINMNNILFISGKNTDLKTSLENSIRRYILPYVTSERSKKAVLNFAKEYNLRSLIEELKK